MSMPKNDLPELTKTMHKSQEKWRTENWNQTLDKHKKEIEELLQKVSVFDVWSNSLQDNEAAKKLIPEIFIDGYISLHFTCFGLYKYANICLRSQLETALRLIYFSTHPVEFDWWCKGNEWYRKGLRARDVWGEGFKYFTQLEYVKKFEKNCKKEKRLFQESQKIKKIYRKLSGYVHTSALAFQTKPEELLISPKYQLGEFKRWSKSFVEVQEYINILLVLSFYREFGKLGETNQERIEKIGIETSHYRKTLKKVLSP